MLYLIKVNLAICLLMLVAACGGGGSAAAGSESIYSAIPEKITAIPAVKE